MINKEFSAISAADRVKINNKHAAKISWKRKQSLEMVTQLDNYLADLGISLPKSLKEFKRDREQIMDYEAYGDEMDKDLFELISLRYQLLRCGKAFYANFTHGEQIKLQMLACLYSKHRFDPVWNYRKSQIIRKVYRQFMKETEVHKQYHPIHLVLTVPHAEGKFQDKEFYLKELLERFNRLRKLPQWQNYIWGGEYGVEVKKSPSGHGLHIHIHCLIFQYRTQKETIEWKVYQGEKVSKKTGKKYKSYITEKQVVDIIDSGGKSIPLTVNEVREWISKEWQKLTGATFTHYETLYLYKKDDKGQTIKEKKWLKDDKTGEWVEREVRKKFYINDFSPLEDYLEGVLECIKYHFKHDCCTDENGRFDIPLIKQILNNSKGANFYNRIGGLRKEDRLDFNRLNKETTHLEEHEVEEEVMASTEGVIQNLINPFTMQFALPGEYNIVLCAPENIKYTPKHAVNPFEPLIYTLNIFHYMPKNVSLKELIRAMISGKLEEMIMRKGKLRFNQNPN